MNAIGNRIAVGIPAVEVRLRQNSHENGIGGQGHARRDLIVAGGKSGKVGRAGAGGRLRDVGEGSIGREATTHTPSLERNRSLQGLQGGVHVEGAGGAATQDKGLQPIGRECRTHGGGNIQGGCRWRTDVGHVDDVDLIRGVNGVGEYGDGSAVRGSQHVSGHGAERGVRVVGGAEIRRVDDLRAEVASHEDLVAGEIEEHGVWRNGQGILGSSHSPGRREAIDGGVAGCGGQVGTSRTGG